MSKKYYTYRICVKNQHHVEIEKSDPQNQSLGRPSGDFSYQKNAEEIKQLLKTANDNQITNEKQSRQLGEALFNSFLAYDLRQDLINFHYKYVQEEEQLLRIELDIDEQEMPEIAALPWEFLCLPEDAHQGTVWLATDPNLVFSRRRALWNPAKPIQLAPGEKLRIALAIASPQNLSHVDYQEIQEYLETLAKEDSQNIELLPIVNPATPTAIDDLLEKKPHIFHFIGHGRLENEEGEKEGQIALVREVLNKAQWVDAKFFAELFVRHRPGIVVLQACEGVMQSESEAFRGVASKIVAQNIPVVVAMQYEIANATASVFSSEFYKRLGKGEPVDIAAQNGRRKIALKTQSKSRDFATPVIFMNVQNGYLFTQETERDQPPVKNDDIIHPSPSDASNSDYRKIIDAFKNGNVVPFFGPGINSQFYTDLTLNLAKFVQERLRHDNRENDLQNEQLIQHLIGIPCSRCHYWPKDRPPECPLLKSRDESEKRENCPLYIEQELAVSKINLRYLSQYYILTIDAVDLYNKLDDILKRLEQQYQPSSLHRFLAQLPRIMYAHKYPKSSPGFPFQLIVTTNYDDMLERAFRDEQQSFDVVFYIADGPEKGKFKHKTYEGELRLIDTSEYDQLPLLKQQGNSQPPRPIILKLFGSCEKVWENKFVATEQHIAYLISTLKQNLPMSLTRILKQANENHILFMGYSPSDSDLQLLMNCLWPNNRMPAKSWLLHPAKPGKLEKKLWEERNVTTIEMPSSLDNFVAQLQEIINTQIQ